MVKKRKKRPKSAKLPIPRNIFFRKIAWINLSEFILYDSYRLGLHHVCWVTLCASSISKVIRVLVKKVDFWPFFVIFGLISPFFDPI